MSQRALPIGESDFQAIIKDGDLYVDKTQQIYQIITKSKPNFLSRPRRFGKSLLISTLEEIFSGNKELFKDLWIYDKIDWQIRPVIRLSFTEIDYKNQDLETSISQYLDRVAEKSGEFLREKTSKEKFVELIKNLSTKQQVVILIDEYDKPIIDFIEDLHHADRNRDILKNFYGALKDGVVEQHVHFLFITGISKFSKTSIFSELNNLDDLTFDPSAIDLCGITQDELELYFEEEINEVVEKLDTNREKLLKNLKYWYNGYSWDGKTSLYNPFSLLNFFKKQEYKNYWFESGTPTFLVKVVQNQKVPLKEIGKVRLAYEAFSEFDIQNMDIYPLLFQTGYLTIKKKGYSRTKRLIYDLAYPNYEVKVSFLYNLLHAYSYQQKSSVSQVLLRVEDALFDNDIDKFVEQLKILFSDIAHQLHPKINKKNPTPEDEAKLFKAWEGYFHSIIYLLIKFLGLHIDVEMSKHKGRIDAKIEVDDYLYIMEFKMDASAQKAMNQIATQQYADAFKNTSKQIVLVGISFDSKICNVKEYQVENLQ